jgi:hypothetical protein
MAATRRGSTETVWMIDGSAKAMPAAALAATAPISALTRESTDLAVTAMATSSRSVPGLGRREVLRYWPHSEIPEVPQGNLVIG